MKMMVYNIILSTTLLGIGIYGLLRKHNLLKVLISIELITIAASMNFILLATASDQSLGQVLLILTFATDSCITAIVLAVLIIATKKYGTWDLQKLANLIGPEPSEASQILDTAAEEPKSPENESKEGGNAE